MKFLNQPSESASLLLISLLGAMSVSLHSALAQSSEGSLDQMWKDPASQTAPAADATAGDRITMPADDTSLDKPQNGSDEAAAGKSDLIRTNATEAPVKRSSQSQNVDLRQLPGEETGSAEKLCTLDRFIHSSVVSGDGWPGLGRFKAVQPGPNTYVDGARNRLGLSVEQDKIVAAELDLAPAPNSNQNFFNLEMGVDFLLEGLGTKSTKINDVNVAIEKIPSLVNGQSSVPTTELSVGDYNVFVERPDPTGDFRIRVKEPSLGNVQVAMADPIPVPDKVADIPAVLNRKVPPLPARVVQPKAPVKPAEQPSKPAENPASKYEDLLNQLQDDNATANNSPRGIAGAELELKKKLFLDVLQKWQRLKKTAVRQRETTELSQALAGKALKRQSDSIKWLAENHKYFDTNSKGIVVERVVAVEPEKKYEVYALVKEESKYVDDTTGQILKESEEVNNVKYVLELSGDHWLIVDSALLKPAAQAGAPTAKPQH